MGGQGWQIKAVQGGSHEKHMANVTGNLFLAVRKESHQLHSQTDATVQYTSTTTTGIVMFMTSLTYRNGIAI